MAIDSSTTGQPGPKSPWFGIGRLLFVVILVILFFYWGRACCGIASLEAARSIGTALSDHRIW